MTTTRQIVLSAVDFARLEPMIRDAVSNRATGRELLCALHSKILQAQVLEPCEMPGDVVTMNSTVRLYDLATDEIETYTLVYPGFEDLKKNCLSILTPLGTAMLGLCTGETLEWGSLGGWLHLRVEEVEFQPESAGQYDL